MPFELTTRAISSPKADTTRRVLRLAEGAKVLALVADDVPENRDVLSKMLSDIGVEVITAANGEQAVEQVRAHQPDIVFMDIRMPVMDGLEAARQIMAESKAANPQSAIKLVAISASVLAHEQERYRSVEFDSFIAKPLLAERIYECLAELLPVEYQYAGTQQVSPLDFSTMTLPKDLCSRLTQAAAFQSRTKMRTCLNEVEQLGEEGRLLAEHLHQLLQNYDMEAIRKILASISHR
ncbi:response regulator [Candidatus Poribacteria bacterium]|nr:response regulator [Candidatus Poribacteria bacterium]